MAKNAIIATRFLHKMRFIHVWLYADLELAGLDLHAGNRAEVDGYLYFLSNSSLLNCALVTGLASVLRLAAHRRRVALSSVAPRVHTLSLSQCHNDVCFVLGGCDAFVRHISRQSLDRLLALFRALIVTVPARRFDSSGGWIDRAGETRLARCSCGFVHFVGEVWVMWGC